jgi:hypothetical protein
LAVVRKAREHSGVSRLAAAAGEHHRSVERNQPGLGLEADNRRFHRAQPAVTLIEEVGFRQRVIVVHFHPVEQR